MVTLHVNNRWNKPHKICPDAAPDVQGDIPAQPRPDRDESALLGLESRDLGNEETDPDRAVLPGNLPHLYHLIRGV